MTSVQIAPRHLAAIQVDLDGLWTNLQYYGHNAPLFPDPVLTTSIPRFLDLFDRFGIKATFFVIGRDAEIPEKRDLFLEIHRRGHELANHTYSHHFGFKELSPEEQKREVTQGEEAIHTITSTLPAGFKAPGYDFNSQVLQLLEERKYHYDSSMMPTFVYPLIMRVTTLLSGGVKRTHGPRWYWMFAPNQPYTPAYHAEWKKGQRKILEVPSSVIPFARLPFHATFAFRAGYLYFQTAYALAKRRKSPLIYELHAADLADDIADSRLAHLRNNPLHKRLQIAEKIIQQIAHDYRVMTTQQLVKELSK